MTDGHGPGHHDEVARSATAVSGRGGQTGHGGHGWMMIVCCIPMLAFAAVLLALGVVSVGFFVFAVLCTAMMALMMRGMSHGGPSSV